MTEKNVHTTTEKEGETTTEEKAKTTNTPALKFIGIGTALMVLPRIGNYFNIAVEMILGRAFIVFAVAQIPLIIQKQKDITARILPAVFVAVGLYFLLNPASTLVAVSMIFAVLAISNSLMNALRAQKAEGKMKIFLAINAFIGVVFAVMIWFGRPFSGLNFMALLLGIQFIVSGVIILYNK